MANPSGRDPLPRPNHERGAAYSYFRPSLRGPLLGSATRLVDLDEILLKTPDISVTIDTTPSGVDGDTNIRGVP